MIVYDFHAKEMLMGRLTADCCDHNLGYSAFLVPIYHFFNAANNIFPLRVIQSALDVTTGILLYFTGKSLFGKKTALVIFILYLINPLTSSFAGLKLAEILTLFFVALISFLITRRGWNKNLLLPLLFGVSLGMLLFTRVAYYYFVFIFLVFISIAVSPQLKRKVIIFTLSLFGFSLASIYPLIAYYKLYNKISLVPPYNMGLSALYLNFYNDRFPELFNVNQSGVNPTMLSIMNEYHDGTYPLVPAFKKKYEGMFWQKIRREWMTFFHHQIRNIVWMWDKNHLYYYFDPFYPADIWPLRIGNMFLMIFALSGYISYIRKQGKEGSKNPMVIFTGSLFLYITFLFSLVSNESRHSLSFYPILFLWGGYGIEILMSKAHDIIRSK